MLLAAAVLATIAAPIIGPSVPKALAAIGTTDRVSLSDSENEGSAGSFSASVSGDGSVVAFESDAANLTFDSPGGFRQIYVRNRATGGTVLASKSSGGVVANAAALSPSISADGNHVAFVSAATNLVPGVTSGETQVYVKNLATGAIAIASSTAAGVGNGPSTQPSISANGDYVAFVSGATNFFAEPSAPGEVYVADMASDPIIIELVSRDESDAPSGGGNASPSISADGRTVAFASQANLSFDDANEGVWDVYAAYLGGGVTELVSVEETGFSGGGDSEQPAISADGRFVAFVSASGIVPGGDGTQVYLRDLRRNLSELLSGNDAGQIANTQVGAPAISADGSVVAFDGQATNLVPGDVDEEDDVFVRDRRSGGLIRASMSSAGVDTGGSARRPSISNDGRTIVYESIGETLVPGDANDAVDVFAHTTAEHFVAAGGVTTRISVTSGGLQVGADSSTAAISGDGMWTVFSSLASTLVPGDANGQRDVFARNRITGRTLRLSVREDGGEANGASFDPSISEDGRFVVYTSGATNLVDGDTNGVRDVFLLDRDTDEDLIFDEAGAFVIVNVSAAGNNHSGHGTVTRDGRYVAFSSLSSNLSGSIVDDNGVNDIFVYDSFGYPTPGVFNVLSRSPGGQIGNGASDSPRISEQEISLPWIVWRSDASNLEAGDTNGASDIFTLTTHGITPIRVSLTSTGAEANGPSTAPDVTDDGRRIVFSSEASNLVPNDLTGHTDVFVRDLDPDNDGSFPDYATATTTRVSLTAAGAEPLGQSYAPRISDDGRFVAFSSGANFMVGGDNDGSFDIFVRDRDADADGVLDGAAATTLLASLDFADGDRTGGATDPSLSDDGRHVAFTALDRLAGGDTNEVIDVYQRDLAAHPVDLASVAYGRSGTGSGAGGTTQAGDPSVSADGRFVAFTGGSRLGDRRGDVWVKDRVTGTVDPAIQSVGSEEVLDSSNPRISANGRYITFDTLGSLVNQDDNGTRDVYRFDRVSRLATLVSLTGPSTPLLGLSVNLDLSADGRYALFATNAANAVPGETPDWDVFVRDIQSGVTSPVWAGASALESFESAQAAAFSDDARTVAFESSAALVASDTNEQVDVYLVDRTAATIRRVSNGTGPGGSASGTSGSPAISANGRFVAFASSAPDIVAGDTNEQGDVFVWDAVTGGRARVSVATSGQSNGQSGQPSLSADGRLVGFHSHATNLVAGDQNGAGDAFLYDRANGTTTIVSRDFAGRAAESAGEIDYETGSPSVSADGSVVAFTSQFNVSGDASPGRHVFAALPAIGPAIPTADVRNLTLLASAAAVEAGAASIPMASIPIERIPALAPQMGDATLGSIPMGSIPMGSIPMGSIGLEAAAAHAPEALDAILISSIPIEWDPILAGSTLEGLNKITITLLRVINDPVAGPKFRTAAASIPLEDFGVDRNLLRGTSVVSALLGSAPMGSIPTPDGSGDWCAVLTSVGYSCAGFDPSTTTMLGLDIAGAPMGSIPMGSIPMGSIPMGSIPMGSIPMGSIPMGSIPMGSIRIASLTNPNQVIDCSRISCDPNDGKTLADAQRMTPSAIRPEAVLAMLQGALGEFTLGEVIVGLLLRSDFPWETVPISGLQDIAGGPTVTYTASFEFTCSEPLTLETVVQTPPGFKYVTGSTTFNYAFSTPPAGPTSPTWQDPVRSGNTLKWPELPLAPCSERPGDNLKVTLGYKMYPSIDLGDYSSGITVTQNGTAFVKSGVATVTVGETFEPNDTKDTATPIQFDHLIVGHIAHAGDRDIYKVALPNGRARVFFTLSQQAPGTDADLVVHVPAPESLQSSPIGSIPMGSIPLEDDAPDFHDDDRSIPPETLSDIPMGSIDLGAVASVSANRGNADERVEFVTESAGGFAYVEVIGYNGSFGNRSHLLRGWSHGPAPLPPSPPRVLPFDADAWNGSDEPSTRGTLPATLPANRQTLFIVNQDRLFDLYDRQAAQDVLTNLGIIAARPEVAGSVLAVDGDAAFRAAYAAWDANPNSISAANGVVRVVNDIVARYRPSQPQLKSIVLVGSDEVLPHARYQDRVTLSNEIDVTVDLAFSTQNFTRSNAMYGSAAQGQIFNDDAYVSFTRYPFLNQDLPLPDIAVGRLVETPAEIVGQLRQYIAANGVANPESALVTGYDFLTDGATVTADELSARFGPLQTRRLINETWTREDLMEAFVEGQTVSDVAAVNAHYSHYLAQPAGARTADGLFGTADIPAPPADPLAESRFTRALMFTVGCHSGLNVPDPIVGNPTVDQQVQLKDWAQTWSGHRTAAYIANTTFGYGDTEASALSERLMNIFAGSLRDQSKTYGELWVGSKHEYFRTAGTYGMYDFKILAGATFYGLPFWRMTAAADPPVPHTPPATSPDPVTGLPTATFTRTPALVRHDTDRGTYWEGPSGTLNVHYRPTQPLDSENVTVPGLVAHGAIITALTTTDIPNIDPMLTRPTIDLEAHEPETQFDNQVFPAQLVTLATSRAFGQETSTLNLIAGQFRSNTPSDGRGVQRNVTSATVKVTYSASTDRTGPVIHELHAIELSPTTMRIIGRATDESAAGVKRFAVLYQTGSGTWAFAELARVGSSDMWRADVTVAAASTTVELAGQAQDAAGNVTITTNKAVMHPALTATAVPDASIVISSPKPGAGYARDSAVYADYACSSSLGILGCTGTVAKGARIDTSGFGVKTFTVTATDGAGRVVSKTIAYVVTSGPPQPPSDTTAPTTQFRADDDIVINVPPALRETIPGRVSDDLSGVQSVTVVYKPLIGGMPLTVTAVLTCNATRRSCDWQADAPTVPGQYQVIASAKDIAGNVETPRAIRSIVVV